MVGLLWQASLLAFVIAVIAVLAMTQLALRIGLVDVPDNRKLHKDHVPLVGGLAVFAGILITALIFRASFSEHYLMLSLAGSLVVVGLLDDLFHLSAVTRFVAQGFAALGMIAWGGVVLTDFGYLLGNFNLGLGVFDIPVTIFCAVGVINAINLLDGIDGLAGGVCAVTLLAIGALCLIEGRLEAIPFIALMLSGILAFLLFNVGQLGGVLRRIFLGDAGSLFLGFILAWMLIESSQGGGRLFAPVTALWLLALPLMDTVFVLTRRMLRGQSPLRPGRDHVHHCLLSLGFSKSATLLILVLASLLYALIGVLLHVSAVAEVVSFAVFLANCILYYLFIAYLWRRINGLSGEMT